MKIWKSMETYMALWCHLELHRHCQSGSGGVVCGRGRRGSRGSCDVLLSCDNTLPTEVVEDDDSGRVDAW